MNGFTFTGASRRRYEYSRLDWEQPLNVPQQGGILLLAKGTQQHPDPVFIADCSNLRQRFIETQNEAANIAQASLLYVRPEHMEQIRQAEVRDLISAYRPTPEDSAEPT